MSGFGDGGRFRATLTQVEEGFGYPFNKVPEIDYEWDSYGDYKRPWEESDVETVVFKRDGKIVEYRKVYEAHVYVCDRDGERLERIRNVPSLY